MPNVERSPRLIDAPKRAERDPGYYYRRPLSFGELLPAIGIGVGAGLFAFYITRLLLQRTPLRTQRLPAARRGGVGGGGELRSD